MKTLPKYPYLTNLVKEYRRHYKSDSYLFGPHYRNWIMQFGFSFPNNEYLQFPDDFPDEDLLAFKLRWG